jgi:hypothetical protein
MRLACLFALSAIEATLPGSLRTLLKLLVKRGKKERRRERESDVV